MQEVWKNYQEKNKDRFLEELLELLRIPSVSAKSEHKPDMIRCAEAVKQRLLEAGADKVEIHQSLPFWCMVIMMCSLRSHWNFGRVALLIQRSSTEKYLQGEAVMIRDRY